VYHLYHFLLNIICPRQTVQYLLYFCSATLLNLTVIAPFLLFVLWRLIMQLGACIDLANAGFKVFLNCHMFETIKIWSFANLMFVLKQASQSQCTSDSYQRLKMSSNQNIRKCQISYNCFPSLVFPQSVFTSFHYASLSLNLFYW
jgi:hypothetical protein